MDRSLPLVRFRVALANWFLPPTTGRPRFSCGSARRVIATGFSLLGLVGFPAASLAESIVYGVVADVVTGLGVEGAAVQLSNSAQPLGSAVTDASGAFRISFDPPVAVGPDDLSLDVQHDGYVKVSAIVPSVDTLTNAQMLQMLPSALLGCRIPPNRRAVVVGSFLPPPGSDFTDLPRRLAETMHFSLRPLVQAQHLPTTLQPKFVECAEADLQMIDLGKDLARALNADAFVSGAVAAESAHFTVSAYVNDAYEVFAGPEPITSTSVDLSLPATAHLSADTHVAILAAVAAGLANQNDCITAIDVIKAAETLVATAPPYLSNLRAKCEAEVPNNGLVGTNSP